MSRSSRERFVFQCGPPIASGVSRRPLANLSPRCEALDNRQLLSVAASVATEFTIPSAALVTTADTTLQSVAPGRSPNSKARWRRPSSTRASISPMSSALAQDEAVVDKDIDSTNISSYDNGNDLNIVQDWVDYAFTYGSIGFHVGRTLYPLSAISQRLDGTLGNVPTVFAASSSDATISPIEKLIDQIKVVAKEARVASAIQSALNHSYTMLNNALGSNPNTMPGPGGTMRDPLIVYYDAQVNNFVK